MEVIRRRAQSSGKWPQVRSAACILSSYSKRGGLRDWRGRRNTRARACFPWRLGSLCFVLFSMSANPRMCRISGILGSGVLKIKEIGENNSHLHLKFPNHLLSSVSERASCPGPGVSVVSCLNTALGCKVYPIASKSSGLVWHVSGSLGASGRLPRAGGGGWAGASASVSCGCV